MKHRARFVPLTFVVWSVALLLAGCPDGSGASDVTADPSGGPPGGDGGVTDPVADITKFSNTTLTGFVFDAVSGKPLYAATVATEPPTETVQTNSNGQFSINVGHAFGIVTIKATRDGYRQAQQTCVNLKPGLNALADISLVKTASNSTGDCVPACTGSTTCVSSVCVSACNPLCACGELCDPSSASGCVEDPSFVKSAICGQNSHPLGQTVCECDLGFVAAGDGKTCIQPGNVGECGENAVSTATGCECIDGYLPGPAGDGCIPADEATQIASLQGDSEVTYKWPTPGPSPRGIAFDGQSLWIGDAADEAIYQVKPSDGSIIKKFDIGAYGKAMRDMTYGQGYLFFTVSTTASKPGEPAVVRLSPSNGQLQVLSSAFGFQETDGIAYDGTYLDSLEGLVIKRRAEDGGTSQFQTSVLLGSSNTGNLFTVVDGVKFLANTQNQFIGWVGTRFDGNTFLAEFVTLNAVHNTKSSELGRIELAVGGSHIAGIEAYGNKMWMVVAGSGKDTPKVVEVQLD